MNSSYLSAPNGVTDFLPSEKAFPCLIDGRFDWDNDLFCIIERESGPKLLLLSPPEMV